jgi:hypothetical protein
MWAPQDYLSKDYLFGQDERVFTFETFRRWLLRKKSALEPKRCFDLLAAELKRELQFGVF